MNRQIDKMPLHSLRQVRTYIGNLFTLQAAFLVSKKLLVKKSSGFFPSIPHRCALSPKTPIKRKKMSEPILVLVCQTTQLTVSKRQLFPPSNPNKTKGALTIPSIRPPQNVSDAATYPLYRARSHQSGSPHTPLKFWPPPRL